MFCPFPFTGQRMAMLEMKVVASRLLRRFRFAYDAAAHGPAKPCQDLVLKPKHGMPLLITPCLRDAWHAPTCSFISFFSLSHLYVYVDIIQVHSFKTRGDGTNITVFLFLRAVSYASSREHIEVNHSSGAWSLWWASRENAIHNCCDRPCLFGLLFPWNCLALGPPNSE